MPNHAHSRVIAIDRTSKLAFARLVEKANTATAVAFLNELVEAVPYKIDVVLPVRRLAKEPQRPNRYAAQPSVRSHVPASWNRTSPDQT